MKTLYSAANGAITITEDQGKISLNIDESLSIGGGSVAGLIKVKDKGSVELDAESALKLGESLINSKLPASVQPLAQVVEGIINQAVKAIE